MIYWNFKYQLFHHLIVTILRNGDSALSYIITRSAICAVDWIAFDSINCMSIYTGCDMEYIWGSYIGIRRSNAAASAAAYTALSSLFALTDGRRSGERERECAPLAVGANGCKTTERPVVMNTETGYGIARRYYLSAGRTRPRSSDCDVGQCGQGLFSHVHRNFDKKI